MDISFEKIGPLIEKKNLLNKEIEIKEKELEELKGELKEVETEISPLKSNIEATMNSEGIKEFQDDKFIATFMVKETKAWGDTDKIIKYLKENKLTQLIKVEEKLDKNGLKKELKTNQTLNENLSPYATATSTIYLVVTTLDNYNKMIEHMEENK